MEGRGGGEAQGVADPPKKHYNFHILDEKSFFFLGHQPINKALSPSTEYVVSSNHKSGAFCDELSSSQWAVT
jgi:hypothetical protein